MIALFFVMVFIGFLFNRIEKKYVLHRLVISRALNKQSVESGEAFTITLTIENRKLLPVAFLQITEVFPLKFRFGQAGHRVPGGQEFSSVLAVLPYQRVSRIRRCSCNHRGRYFFQSLSVSGGDLLGIDTVNKPMEDFQEIIVLPKPINLNRGFAPWGSYYGNFSIRRWIMEDPILTVGIKEYTGTEPYHTIHWASSLKCGKLMVRQFDHSTDRSVKIILNIETAKPFWANIDEAKIEKCISIARSIVEQLEAICVPFVCCTDADTDDCNDSRSGCGRTHTRAILEMLGGITYRLRCPLEQLLLDMGKTLKPNTSVILITPSILQSYIEPINSLYKSTNQMMVVSLNPEHFKNLKQEILCFSENGI